MGALTLKSFPFELRGWDLEKFESIDPTDCFGSNTRVYVAKDQIVQIEPDYDTQTCNAWLTDKGRQFFDSIFGVWVKGDKKIRGSRNNSWSFILGSVVKTVYILDHCNYHNSKKGFFTVIFENLSLELVSILILLSQKYSFIKIRRGDNVGLRNDLESSFQLNSVSNKASLGNSSAALLISTNPRYEGYYLNLNLRQRFFKGNFKCFHIGSLINQTFPTIFLGSNLNVLKTIAEGHSLVCQDLKKAKNLSIISNSAFFKRKDNQIALKLIKIINNNASLHSLNNFNVLSATLCETGTNSLSKFTPLSQKDWATSSSFYFLNVNAENIVNLKKIIESKLLNYFTNFRRKGSNFILDQSSVPNNNIHFFDEVNITTYCKYVYLPSSMFYENEETFINTEGLVKRTNRLVFKKQTKNNWNILRKIFQRLNTELVSLDNKNNLLLTFNSRQLTRFKNFVYFLYQATQLLTSTNFYLGIRTKSFLVKTNTPKFRYKTNKLLNTKLKYWLDDFYIGGKDEYSHNSLVLSDCSKLLRSESANFF